MVARLGKVSRTRAADQSSVFIASRLSPSSGPARYPILSCSPRPSSTDDPGLDPVGEVADLAPLAELRHQDQGLGPGQVHIDRLRGVADGHRRRDEAFLAIDQDAEDDAPQRARAVVEADERL